MINNFGLKIFSPNVNHIFIKSLELLDEVLVFVGGFVQRTVHDMSRFGDLGEDMRSYLLCVPLVI